MKQKIPIALLTLALWMPAMSLAQDFSQLPPPPATTDLHADHSPRLSYNHPTLPAEALWPGTIVILIIGSFALAAGVGVTVRLHALDGMPVAHSHDEPPGSSHHHGPGGTVQPGPEHDLPGGHAHPPGGH